MRLLLSAAAVVVLAVGCGDAENEPNLAAAIDQTTAAGSSLIEIDAVEIDGGKPADIECRGQADYEREHLQIRCNYGGVDDMEMISVGGDTYVRGDVLGIGGAGGKWTKFPDDEALAAELAPQRLLSMLRDASQNTRRVGAEDVRGVGTLRYRLEVDCEQVELFDCEGTTTPVDIWIGEDGLVRRISLEEKSGSGTIEFYDFGIDVAIEAPPANQVEDLGDLVGPTTCRPDDGTPISLEQAVESLQRNGFTISDRTSCDGGSAVFRGTQASGRDLDREGQVSCLLHFEPRGEAPTSTQRRGADGADAELTLRNLTCTIFVDSPRGEAKIDMLEAAFAELEAQIRP